jgi:hypothetical protein
MLAKSAKMNTSKFSMGIENAEFDADFESG